MVIIAPSVPPLVTEQEPPVVMTGSRPEVAVAATPKEPP
jgi:hypothetical protein